MQFCGLADSVVILVNPEAERGKDLIAGVDHSVGISSLLKIVIDGQGSKSIGMRGRRLRREIAEELLAVGDDSFWSGKGEKGVA